MKITEGSLSFSVNDIDLGIAFKDWRLLEPNLIAFAWLGEIGDQILLLEGKSS